MRGAVRKGLGLIGRRAHGKAKFFIADKMRFLQPRAEGVVRFARQPPLAHKAHRAHAGEHAPRRAYARYAAQQQKQRAAGFVFRIPGGKAGRCLQQVYGALPVLAHGANKTMAAAEHGDGISAVGRPLPCQVRVREKQARYVFRFVAGGKAAKIQLDGGNLLSQQV